MELYKSIVAYDGTDFSGFQRQGAGERTVQGELEHALRELAWEGASLKAAGRTDAGVHAAGQVISYRLRWRHAPDQLTAALNARLPADLAIRHTERAPNGFDPRRSALRRTYRYRLWLDPTPDPLRERYAWRIWPQPDLEAMQSAGSALLGRRDFGALGQAPNKGRHTVRSLTKVEWARSERMLSLVVQADAFLRNMARRLVAILLEVGWGRMDSSQLNVTVADPSHVWDGGLAPAHGLCLERVHYEDAEDWSDRGAEDLLPKGG